MTRTGHSTSGKPRAFSSCDQRQYIVSQLARAHVHTTGKGKTYRCASPPTFLNMTLEGRWPGRWTFAAPRCSAYKISRTDIRNGTNKARPLANHSLKQNSRCRQQNELNVMRYPPALLGKGSLDVDSAQTVPAIKKFGVFSTSPYSETNDLQQHYSTTKRSVSSRSVPAKPQECGYPEYAWLLACTVLYVEIGGPEARTF